MSFIFVTGGIRSGKSMFAEQLAARSSSSVLYAAFGVAVDDEMRERIHIHQQRRPVSWGTSEATVDLCASMSTEHDTILVDCLSTWLANRCMQIPEREYKRPVQREAIHQEFLEWLGQVQREEKQVIAVSSEVGLGGVAMSSLGRLFQDLLGEFNQLAAQQADEVYVVFSGIPLRIKG